MLSFMFAIFFLGEHPSAREVRGMLIAVAGVFFLVLGATREGSRATWKRPKRCIRR
jgi:drug/metabolite transporter (DMT)-like permease